MRDTPNPPDTVLSSIYAALERNLMRASERIREAEWTWFCLSTFRAENGRDAQHASEGPDAYVDRFRAFLNRLSKSRPDRLRKHIDLWPDPEPYIFEKLRLYVWNKPELFSAVEIVERILALSDDAFWRTNQQRDLMFLLSGRWAEFPAEGRDTVGRRILDGPPRRDDEDEDEDEATYLAGRQRAAAVRFGWLVQAGCGLSDGLVAEWTALKSGLGEWRDSWIAGAVAASEVLGGSVRTDEDASVLDGVPIAEIAQAALTHSGRAWNSFVEKRPFSGLVKCDPVRAVLALAAATRRGEFPEILWNAAIRDWPDNAPRRATGALHGRMRRLPPEKVFAMRGSVAYWLAERFPKAVADDRVLAYEVFDHVVECFPGAGSAATDGPLGEPTIRGTRAQAPRRTYGHAVNGPTGKATEGLLKVLAASNLGEGTGLPDDFKTRVNRLLADPGEGSDHVVCVLSNRIRWLNHVDAEWVAARMIPWFRLDRCWSEPAWSGILWNSWQDVQPVFGAIKSDFLALPSRMYAWGWGQETERYYCWVVAATLLAGDDGPRLSFEDARDCLRRINPEGRRHVVWFLRRMGARGVDGWRQLVIPFIRRAWPNERRYQTSDTSEAWLHLLGDTGDSFPNVLHAVWDGLRPVNSGWPVLHALDREAGATESLPAKYPRETLDLLDRVVPDNSRDVTRGLSAVLELMVAAEPALLGDTRYRRLHGLTAEQ